MITDWGLRSMRFPFKIHINLSSHAKNITANRIFRSKGIVIFYVP